MRYDGYTNLPALASSSREAGKIMTMGNTPVVNEKLSTLQEQIDNLYALITTLQDEMHNLPEAITEAMEKQLALAFSTPKCMTLSANERTVS